MNVLWKFLFITLLLYATVDSKKLCDRKFNFCKKSKCNCPEGLKPNKNKTCCVPICEDKCIGGKCVGLNKCKCLPGHMATEIPNVCEPFCSNCSNGYCYGYEKCANRRWNSKNSVEPKTQCGMDVFTTTTANILDDNTELPKSTDISQEVERFESSKPVELNSATEFPSKFPEKKITENIDDLPKSQSSTSPTEVKATSSSLETELEQTSKSTSKTTNPSSRLQNLEEFEIIDEIFENLFDEFEANLPRILQEETISKDSAVFGKILEPSTTITMDSATEQPLSRIFNKLQETRVDEILSTISDESETISPMEENPISNPPIVNEKFSEEQLMDDEVTSRVNSHTEILKDSEKSFSYEVKIPGIDDIIPPTTSEDNINLILLEETNSNSPAIVEIVPVKLVSKEELPPNIQLLNKDSTISPQLEEQTSNSPPSFFGKVGNKLKMTEELQKNKLLVEPSSAEEFRLAAVPLGVGILIGIVVLGLLVGNHYRNQRSYNVLQN